MSAPVMRPFVSRPRILLATKDPILRQTRKEVLLSFGYDVAAPISKSESLTLIHSERFDLLILGDTLDRSTKLQFEATYRKQQSHGRIIEIISSVAHSPVGNPDAAVVGLEGPPALQHAIQQQLRRVGDTTQQD